MISSLLNLWKSNNPRTSHIFTLVHKTFVSVILILIHRLWHWPNPGGPTVKQHWLNVSCLLCRWVRFWPVYGQGHYFLLIIPKFLGGMGVTSPPFHPLIGRTSWKLIRPCLGLLDGCGWAWTKAGHLSFTFVHFDQPRKHETLTPTWVNAGPPSAALAQQWSSIDSSFLLILYQI